jgi:hypothetical protein
LKGCIERGLESDRDGAGIFEAFSWLGRGDAAFGAILVNETTKHNSGESCAQSIRTAAGDNIGNDLVWLASQFWSSHAHGANSRQRDWFSYPYIIATKAS